MKKMNLLALLFALLLFLSACSNEKDAKNTEKPSISTEAEAVSETRVDVPKTDLDLPATDKVVVVVNGEEINGTVYNSVARQLESSLSTQGKKVTDPGVAEQVKEQALNVIVGNKLIIQDAVEKGHDVDEELLEQRFEDLKNQFENEEQMTITLKRTGFTLDDMKLQLREKLIYEKYLADEIEAIEVKDEDLKEAYQGYVDSTEGETPEFEEMKPMILQSLEEQNEKLAVYDRIEELREAADIDIKI